MKKETAYFAAGCFWGIEYKFSKLPGVISTRVGYMGGDENNLFEKDWTKPKTKLKKVSYENVCKGNSGFAETVEVVFDSSRVDYKMIVEIFWKIHNPTTMNRQGLDIGPQYRSVVFYTSKEQKKIAEQSLNEEQKKLKDKIVTQIVKAGKFFKAEDYHQKYVENGGICSI